MGPRRGPHDLASKTVSRVLYLAVIYLGGPLPDRSSHLLRTAGPAMRPPTVLLRIEFTASDSLQPMGELLPRLSTLTSRRRKFHITRPTASGRACSFHCASFSPPDPRGTRWAPAGAPLGRGGPVGDGTRRYISVALFLKSPSAGVTRYPCPVEPGLSSRRAFRSRRATACLTRPTILQERGALVNESSPPSGKICLSTAGGNGIIAASGYYIFISIVFLPGFAGNRKTRQQIP